MTTQDMINSALRLLGVLASGEVATADQSTDALTALNNMLDTWSTESLLVYARANETFSVTSGKTSYTWGSGGDLNSTRPIELESASVRLVNGSTTFDLPIEIVNQDQWNEISVKSVSTNVPQKIFVNEDNPLASVFIWPIPSQTITLLTWARKPFTAFSSTLSATVSFPPGYQKALIYGLAIEIAPEYGANPSELVVLQSAESKATLKRANKVSKVMKTDDAIQARNSTFNWYTGE